jgi:hypothetical protein
VVGTVVTWGAAAADARLRPAGFARLDPAHPQYFRSMADTVRNVMTGKHYLRIFSFSIAISTLWGQHWKDKPAPTLAGCRCGTTARSRF